jgi:YD repeat-containing protein
LQTTETRYEGLVTRTLNPKRHEKSDLRNGAGQLIQTTDAKNGKTRYGRDPFGRLAKTIDPLGNVISIT